MENKNLISVENVRKTFSLPEGQELVVIDDLSLNMEEGEIVALLGKSGSGKSTLLRIIAGLVEPSGGKVTYRGKLVNEPVEEIAMVFQSFALMPWMTVLQNVELGLEALGIDRDERRKRALKAIDMIGLDGFESAYPKELSGGMRQRVGFARALVVNPELLVMDEPFSALDVLTADSLRNDLLDLWLNGNIRTKGILFVTHNIEEAALMANKIIIFGSDPGHIRAELKLDSQIPRSPNDENFRSLVDEIYTLMTTTESKDKVHIADISPNYDDIDMGYRLPDAEVSKLIGLIETIYSAGNEEGTSEQAIDLPDLADSLHLTVDELFPLTEALEILDLAKVFTGDIKLTELGDAFAQADILERKKIFAKTLENTVPLASHIKELLHSRMNHRESEEFFLKELEESLSEGEAERVLKVIIDWGRYAEIFAYNYDSGILSLENPE